MNNSDLNEKAVPQVEETTANAAETTVAKVNETETPTTVSSTEKVEETSSNTTEVKEEEKKETAVPTTTAVAQTQTPAVATNTQEKKEEPKPLVLNYLDADFIFDVLSVPTVSRAEYRMVTFIIMWARENNIKYEFDNYGNIYLTKGELEEGEFYPCVTSHLDTVQSNQEPYAQAGIPLRIKERVNAKGGHELYVDGMGIGADDKAGVLISLSLFKYVDKLKACFFLEEEIGMCGSKQLNKKWFEDVAYVLGWDSPDRNRAAYASSGELLFSKEFFLEIEDVCKEHGLTNFRSEPYTDVKEIRSQTEVVCANFGNGGYLAHAHNEYVVMEDMDAACGMGVALIQKLGTKQYRMKSKKDTYSVYNTTDEDLKFFADKFKPSYSYYRGGSSTYSSTTSSTTSKTTPPAKPTQVKDDNKLEPQVLEHVMERYEKFIDDIQKKTEEREAAILASIKALCTKNGVDYAEYLQVFLDNPSTDPFSTAIEF